MPGDLLWPLTRVLQGLRVVEIGQYVAAPLAATIFADLGAQVIEGRATGRRPAARRPGPLRRLEPG